MHAPEIRHEVGTEDLKEAPLVDGRTDSTEPEKDADDRDDNLAVLVSTENHCFRVVVYSKISIFAPDL